MPNPVEVWKAEKHSFEVWSDIEKYAAAATPMDRIEQADLERMKWYGFFYRKRDAPGRYMNRIRITANELTAAQAREVAMIAYQYGHGIVDVTTRANLQVQGLGVEHLPQVARQLELVGLSSKQTGHDNIRNVFGHPFSGIVPHELIDTRQLCRDVDAVFVGSREYSDLPRKLNICFNGMEEHPAHFWTQDLSFLAARNQDGAVGFQVLLAGTQGQNPRLAWHLPVFVHPHQVAPLTEAIIQLFRAKGSREKRNNARLRYLVEEIGIGGVLEWLEQTLPFRLEPSVRKPSPSAVPEEFVGWFRQIDAKLWTMGLSVPLGRLTWQQLEGLAVLSKKWGNGQLRTTQEQGIAVINIPTGFKGAAATDAAALGLSVHADEYELNTVACTGSQFCNIAVTETKGHMFQLIEKLRKKALKLHGIHIHMSGCPSSCAQHFTADIGMKGVRVRRLIGTREGFDVYLGGGISGQVHMGLLYRLGVDVDQLPQLIEEVTKEFYQRHKPGQTFSSYWREKLQAAEALKVEDGDYHVPTWVCEGCQYRHLGLDPPVFCPSCAGLRRLFARIEDGNDPAKSDASAAVVEEVVPTRADGFVLAATFDDVPERTGLTVTLQGREYALFRVDSGVKCIDSACPHEGASLADGEINNGVVTCPWHNWTFNACTGCSVDPPGNDVHAYPTLIENGQVFVKLAETATPSATTAAVAPTQNGTSKVSTAQIMAAARGAATKPKPAARPVEAELPVLEIIEETPDVRTFRLDNRTAKLPFDLPGKFAKVCVSIEGQDVWRSFTISSSPTQVDSLDLTIKLNPAGQVTRHLFEHVSPGAKLRIKGAQGGFCFNPETHAEPLVLISAGSGVTPMMSIVRFLAAHKLERPCTFLYGARSAADIIFHDECLQLAAAHPWFKYFVTLSQPSPQWPGPSGRLGCEWVGKHAPSPPACRYFLCGPNAFMEELRAALLGAGVPDKQIHTEQFHTTKTLAGV